MPEDATLDAFTSSDASDGESDADDEIVETDPESEAVESSAADGSEADSADSSADDSADDSTDDSVDDSTGDSGNVPTETADESAEVDISDVDPARSTYDWTPDGGECADCGASAERRWRADGQKDGGLVCADCKEW